MAHTPEGQVAPGVEGCIDEDDREVEWQQSALATLAALHAASILEEGAVDAYYAAQGLEAPQDSGDPKNPNPDYVAAVETVASMQQILEPLLASSPECFAHRGQCQAFFRLSDTCLVLASSTVPPGSPLSEATWSVSFQGAAAEAPQPSESPGLTKRNIDKFFACLQRRDGAAHAAETLLCSILQEDQEGLVADQRKAIRLDFVFTNLLFGFESGWTSRVSCKIAQLALQVLDQSTLGPWLVMGEKRQNLSQSESFKVLSQGLMLLAAPDVPATPILTPLQAKQFTSHLEKTFYKHYSLYQSVYSLDREADKLEKQLQIETAAHPLPTSTAKSLEQVQQEEEDAKRAADLEAYRQQRAEQEAELTKKLLEEDPEAERIVQAIVRKQREAMKANFEQHYAEIEAKIAGLEPGA